MSIKQEIHAHEVMRMMEGKSFSQSTLKQAVIEKFGENQLFHTCSEKELNIDNLIEFLTSKGKFKSFEGGFTVDLEKVCKDY